MSVFSPDSRRTRSAAFFPGLVFAFGAVMALVATTVVPADASTTTAKLVPSRPIERVLLISIPHVGWADLLDADAPNLERLLARSAVANMTARSGGGGFVSGYLTLGAGKRSKGTDTPSDGMGFGVDERFGAQTAADAYARRTGIRRDRGLVQLGIVAIQEVNDAESGGSSVGALGRALRAGGFRTAVIGNSDGSVPDDGLARYRRYLVTALMGATGSVDGGRVDRGLLEVDPDAPFGVRLDNAAVVEAFRAEWVPRSVVLVEASDLLRAVAARPLSVAAQDRRNFRAALERSDDLVGMLLEQVDPDRDAVVVVSPYGSGLTKRLTIVGVQAPGIEPGLLRSSSTRRNGFVLLADVAPTVLQLLDIARPKSMNGRPFVVGEPGQAAPTRFDHLVDEADAALFRDRVLTPVTILATVAAGLVAVGAIVAWETRRRRPWVTIARVGASWLLGLVPAVYLARLVPFHDADIAPYYLFIAGVALLLAAVYEAAGARDPTRSPTLALGVVVGLLVVDLVTGARLQLSTAFGYTPSIGVRFAGVGNVAYAFLAASTVLLAGLLAHRVGGRRGAWVAVTLMAVALVVDAAPFLGGDVGGVLSLTPAYLVTALLLFGSRLRLRTIAGGVAAAVVGLLLAAALDLARPARDRTHLGRLVTNARERGLSEITDVIGRKLSRNLDTWTTSAWRSMLVIGVLFVGYLAWRAHPRVAALLRHVPELRASLVGFGLLTGLGYALNDSGVAIPAVMFVVFVATMVQLLTRTDLADKGTRSTTQPAETSEASTDSVRVATPSH
jgi:hypothetical protein